MSTEQVIQYDNFINGQTRAPQGDEYEDVIDPSTEEVIARAPLSSAADVDAAVAAAREALAAWARTLAGPARRADLRACQSDRRARRGVHRAGIP